MVSSGKYTAEKLALRAGIPLRTVRFYVQEKLIDPPLGRGPGAHFTEHHLHQLQQARTLQNGGLSLDQIRERKSDLTLGKQATAVWDTGLYRRLSLDETRELHRNSAHVVNDGESDDDELDPSKCIRIPMADGVELLVSDDVSLPSPKQLVQIAMQIRKSFRQK